MPKRDYKSAVFDHFIVDGSHYVCQCHLKNNVEKKCEARLSAVRGSGKNAPSRAANLKRHLLRFHSEILEIVHQKDKMILELSQKKKETSQTLLPKCFTSGKVAVAMTKERFKHHIIEMIMENRVPFSFFSQPSVLGLIGEMARKLGISLEIGNITRMIVEEAKCKKVF